VLSRLRIIWAPAVKRVPAVHPGWATTVCNLGQDLSICYLSHDRTPSAVLREAFTVLFQTAGPRHDHRMTEALRCSASPSAAHLVVWAPRSAWWHAGRAACIDSDSCASTGANAAHVSPRLPATPPRGRRCSNAARNANATVVGQRPYRADVRGVRRIAPRPFSPCCSAEQGRFKVRRSWIRRLDRP